MKGLTAAAARLIGLAALAIAAVSVAAYSAAASSSVDTHPGVADSGFAGPVAAPPRPLDTDLTSSTGALRHVRCAAALPGSRCWVAGRTLTLK